MTLENLLAACFVRVVKPNLEPNRNNHLFWCHDKTHMHEMCSYFLSRINTRNAELECQYWLLMISAYKMIWHWNGNLIIFLLNASLFFSRYFTPSNVCFFRWNGQECFLFLYRFVFINNFMLHLVRTHIKLRIYQIICKSYIIRCKLDIFITNTVWHDRYGK